MRNNFFVFVLIIVLLFFAVSGNLLAQEKIKWIDNYEGGLKEAKEQEKNILILVTAPSWCYPCQWMDANTFEDEKIIDIINKNFVPIRIVDMIDGKQNPDLEEISFNGFPTTIYADSSGNILFQKAGALDSVYMFKMLERALNYDKYIEELEKDFNAIKEDNNKAAKFIDKLFQDGEYIICKKLALELFNLESTEQKYRSNFLYTALLCDLYLDELEDGLELLNLYIKTFSDGEHIESVKYFKILVLYYLGREEEAKINAEEFKKEFPESIYIPKINELFE